MKLNFPDLTFKAELVMGQSTYGWTMLGGYVAEKVSDPEKMLYDFEPLDVISMWTDIHTNGSTWQFGVFAGYSQNWGAGTDIKTELFLCPGIFIRIIHQLSLPYFTPPDV
ncbi:MAG: hypothetical protein U5Q03_03040 [Bacteroidota bacterium]|nr:hypothetical protein [Bacteroidota bacterium]